MSALVSLPMCFVLASYNVCSTPKSYRNAMSAVTSGFPDNGHQPKTLAPGKTNNSLVPVATQPRHPPVRVKLRRVNANLTKVYPPDGEGKKWWKRLKKALGTSSSDFVNASLAQLQAAARLPSGTLSEVGLNAALAVIEAAAPKDEIEGALAVQMASTHAAALAVLNRLGGGSGTERRVVAFATAAARLLRAFSLQVETLRRLRHGGDQHVRVEHVHINEGGQAIIGNVKPARSGASGSPEHDTSGMIARAGQDPCGDAGNYPGD